MTYSVHELAKLAGVTPRTLRYYHKVGLLCPAHQNRNGYRYYEQTQLLRLQQILFFRELEFSLEDIKQMLDNPGFNALESLKYQKRLLQLKQRRLGKIIATITQTMTTMTNQQKPTEADMYGSLSQAEIETYKQEAKERWGNTDAYRQSQERTSKFTKQDWQKIKDESVACTSALVELMKAGQSAESPEAQEAVAQHFSSINRFYDCTKEIYLGLADMYVQDPRFNATYTKIQPGLAEYLSAGMKEYAKKL